MDLTIILKNALELIAQGTVDIHYPLRCAPREILMKYAKDALSRYENAILTSAIHSDGEGRAVLEGVDYIVNNIDCDTISLIRR